VWESTPAHRYAARLRRSHTRLYALPAWGILVVGSEENLIVARTFEAGVGES